VGPLAGGVARGTRGVHQKENGEQSPRVVEEVNRGVLLSDTLHLFIGT
jgi:hypothetical protein